ncbi:MAG TPA: hypothetical protein GXZ90_07430 [Clostridiales bacterium]|nr:hypothetical protein [Clostridiales bacterium]
MKSKVLYDQRLCNDVATYVIDDVCIKRRGGKIEDLTKQEIQDDIENYNNIGIQTNKKVEIYCDEHVFTNFKIHFEFNKNLERFIKVTDQNIKTKKGNIVIQSKSKILII